ncbi:mechanosensitive ion channel domain-containing protein [Aureliella helgolandensis]|uniref:Mechanosensitive channel MscK n=1 Tax=Aureliella helgolandensis TaxID=2527968 RepID=A0A518G6B5_9BACT|nr:mechanosensitive ion channel domain-containing protein [Aureliella helgolandensis]QDV24127.1 Mechanosensitive channel MscK precursor [Aureliella helgolandensis]
MLSPKSLFSCLLVVFCFCDGRLCSTVYGQGPAVLNGPSGPAANLLASNIASPNAGLRSSAGTPATSSDRALSTGVEERLKPERVAQELQAVEALSEQPAEVKKDLIERLNKANEWLQSEQVSAKRLHEFEKELAALPELANSVQAELAKPTTPIVVEFPDGVTIPQLESKLTELRHQVEVDEKALREKEAETENRSKRLAEISKESIDLEKRLADAKQQLSTLVGAEVPVRVKRLEQQARIQARQQQLSTLKLEQSRLESVTELLPMQRDLYNRSHNFSKKLLQTWQSAVDVWRKEESRRQATEARLVAENSHPALKSLANQNAEIAERRIQTAADIERSSKTIKRLREASLEISDAFADLKNKVDHAGATSSTGVLLLKQRDELPPDREFHERAKFVQKVMPEAHLRLMEFNQLRNQMSDPAEMATQLLSSFRESLGDYDQQSVLEVLTRLLNDRRDFLNKAWTDQGTYLSDLNELEIANQTLHDEVEEFREYLDQRVMWIRSAEPVSSADLARSWKGAANILSPRRWLEAFKVAGGEVLRRPAAGFAAFSLFMLLLLGRARLLAIQTQLCEPALPGQVDSFRKNIGAIAIAAVMAARWPVLLLAIGMRLKVAASASPWTQAVGDSCLTAVMFLWGCELMREVCRRKGIGEKLFNWPADSTASVRNTLEFTLLIGTPLLAFLQLSQFSELSDMKAFERLLFVATMVLCSVQLGLLTRPKGRLLNSQATDTAEELKAGPSNFAIPSPGILHSLRIPIWLFATFSPLALAILSLVGYHFSAYQLSARLAETGGTVAAVILLHSMLLSWLDVKTHNDRLRQPKPTQPEHLADVILQDQEGAGGESDLFDEDEILGDAAKPQQDSYQQFRDLMRYAAVIGLLFCGWFIWDSVLPALRILDQFELWTNIEKVTEVSLDENGREALTTFDRRIPTTLTDILMAFAICAATFSVGRRIPSLLELTVLERLPIDQGGRQAVGILVRYAATLAGLLVACHFIRLSWSSVQWLAAAMTVGLGFGLQEIFANLVSGIIILFERPIRAGDLVTVGDITGNVTRMRMRATTITDFDRRELIVPNKTFITDNVINWTLSDPISRVVLPIGVAYGTDVHRTQAILLRIAKRSAFVMQEPAPSTLFKGFGDSTLNLELRVFIPRRDLYIEVVNELNLAIVREFQRFKIEIAFPQRDLHIKSVESLQPLLSKLREPAEREVSARAA